MENLHQAFYDPEKGYVGAEKLYSRLKHTGITFKQVKDFLRKQEVVQASRKQKDTGSFVPEYPLQEFQIDLIYIENRGLNHHSYAMTCIDIFTKIADVQLMKKRTAEESVATLQAIISRMGIPDSIMCDEGSEFNNRKMRHYLEQHNIELILTLNHAPFVERFNRTLKEMIEKYLQATKSKTITNVLPKILSNYNSSYHRSIGMAPNEVNKENQEQVWQRMYSRAKHRKKVPIKVGDKVRALKKIKGFAKGYKPRWGESTHVTDIDGRYYKVAGQKRKYLRAALQKIDEAHKPDITPDFEGTLEDRLKKGLVKKRVVRQRETRNETETRKSNRRKREGISIENIVEFKRQR